MSQKYTPTSRELPPNYRVVETIESGGSVNDLMRKDALWYRPDMSSPVYFVPIFWRNKD